MCLHEETIDNYREGEVVCTLCGLVLDQIFGSCYKYRGAPYIVDEIDDFAIRETLMDVMGNINLPNGLKEQMLVEYKVHRVNKKLRLFKNNEILCFTIYDNLIKNEIPRQLDDICYRCHVKRSRICSIQTETEFNDLDPTLLVERIIGELEIPYNNLGKIIAVVRQLEEISCAKPETMTACAIFAHMMQGEKNLFHQDKNILKSICHHCDISESSVKSLFKRYRKSQNAPPMPNLSPEFRSHGFVKATCETSP